MKQLLLLLFFSSLLTGCDTDRYKKRKSGVTATLTTRDSSSHGSFTPIETVASSNTLNDDLWQRVNSTPWPRDYRVPTKAEWEAELAHWNDRYRTNTSDAPLQLPTADERPPHPCTIDTRSGLYWSGTYNNFHTADPIVWSIKD